MLRGIFGRRNGEATKKIEERFALGPTVIVHDFEPLQERYNAQYGIVGYAPAAVFRVAQSVEMGLYTNCNCGRDRTRGPNIADRSAQLCAIIPNLCLQCLADIQIDRPRLVERSQVHRAARKPHQHFVPLNEFLGHANIAIWKRRRIDGRNLLMPMRFPQILAAQRAIDRNLPFRSATDTANISTHAGTMPSRPPNTANYTIHVTSIGTTRAGRREWKQMRTNVFLKVVVEHDEKETPEKLAAELCRQLERNYIVRKAELLHYTGKED